MNRNSERVNIAACLGMVLLILLPVCGVKGAENTPKLLELAEKKFTTLTEAEEKLCEAVVNGELADYSDTSVDVNDPNNDPNNAEDWDKETRAIRAKILSWLCTDKEASSMVTHKGVLIQGIRVDGKLDLEFSEILFPLLFIESAFLGGIDLRGAEIRELFLNGTHTGPIRADGAKIKGDIFLRDGFKAKGEVRLVGATIGGNLDCDGSHFINKGAKALIAHRVKIECDVFLRNGFKAEGEVNLNGATIGGGLYCDNAEFIDPNGTALNADAINVKDDILLINGFKAEGEVNLVLATIGSNLECDKGQFTNPGGKALTANRAKIEGDVFLRDGFKAEGEVCLVGATIGGNLECDKSEFINEGAIALDTNVANIGGSVFLRRGFKAEGEVNLMGATIGENLECDNGEFFNPNGNALNADDIDVKGNVYFRDKFKAEGNVNLVSAVIDKYLVWKDVNSPKNVTLDIRSASIGVLYDDSNSWPDPNRLLIHGLVYKEIHDDAPRDAERRIDWLQRQYDEKAEKDKKQFRSQPYEQLAAVLRKSGKDSDAKDILIAKNKHKAQLSQLTWWEKIWYRWLGPMIGYGYRPQKAIWRMGIIIVLGWLIFGFGYYKGLITPDSESHYVEKGSGIDIPWDDTRQLSKDFPRFSYFMYSIDVFVPLIDLHQVKYWLPNVNRGYELKINGYSLFHTGSIIRLYLWFHLIMGWTLTTMLVVGLTGLIRT